MCNSYTNSRNQFVKNTFKKYIRFDLLSPRPKNNVSREYLNTKQNYTCLLQNNCIVTKTQIVQSRK